MITINKPSENMGGLIKIWAVPSTAYNSAEVKGREVTFLSPDDIYEIYCSPDSLQHDEPGETSHAGVVYNMAVTGFSPGNSEDAREAFEDMENQKFIVIFIDGNGDYFLAGDYQTPLRFTSNFSSGRNTADRAGHELSFTGKTFVKAIPVDDPF